MTQEALWESLAVLREDHHPHLPIFMQLLPQGDPVVGIRKLEKQ